MTKAPQHDELAYEALIAEAARLIEPEDGEAVFYIRVGGSMTQMRVKTKGHVDPDAALRNAIAAINGEREALSNCPVHRRPPAQNSGDAVSGEGVDVEVLAAQVVTDNIDNWGWGPLEDCEGHSEHTLMINAAEAGVRAAIAALRTANTGRDEVLERLVHENGPVVIDFFGEDLAWRPLDYGTWTVLKSSPPVTTVPDEGWQPIETAPKDGTWVDLWWCSQDGNHGKRIAKVRWDDNRSFNRSFNGGIGRVAMPSAWVHDHGGECWLNGGTLTHWRPLPAPPTTDEGETR